MSNNLSSEKQKIDQILSLVQEVIDSRKPSWTAGEDWVYYAGPYFNSEEYIETVSTLLDGWLVWNFDK